ncbi:MULTISPECIES: hypothetical protein [unclassified Roseateles]|uniref:hypothetical protein n=1 Tax=unclassified Roseateles TaxID=2626991 RepID=UPI0012E3BFBC|nr:MULTISPECIES: hypothetical protein [unclassified Roseateles]
MDVNDYLSRLLPHRLNALSIAILMLKFRLKWEESKPMQIFVDGSLQFEGLTTMFTNPTVEVGVLHARALLEFVGLKVSRAGELIQLSPATRQSDDAGIEKIVGIAGPLHLVSPAEVGAIHPIDAEGAKRALARLIVAAHKGLAHSSASYFSNPPDAQDILLGLQVTECLVERHVYVALGRLRPTLPIEARARNPL